MLTTRWTRETWYLAGACLLAALAGCGGGRASLPGPDGDVGAAVAAGPNDPRGVPPALSNVPSPPADAGTARDAGTPEAPSKLPDVGAGPDVLVNLAEVSEVARTDASAPREAAADSAPDVLPAVPDASPDLLPDLVGSDLPAAEAGREVGREAAPACPQSCFVGCNVGCGVGNQCVSCATCTCEVVTGNCHC